MVHVVLTAEDDHEADFVRYDDFALHATHLNYTELVSDRYMTGDGGFFITTQDVASAAAKVSFPASPDQVLGYDFALEHVVGNDRGDLAWSGTVPMMVGSGTTSVQVRTAAGIRRVVATGPVNSIANLSIDDATVFWTQDGQPHSVPITPGVGLRAHPGALSPPRAAGA